MEPLGSWRKLTFLSLAIVLALAITLHSDTYSAWKARVFTQEEQADPAISGELALSPAGDGIPNLLKYAFAVDPHIDGSLALPTVSLRDVVDPETGLTTRYPKITFRLASEDSPTDLYFLPELSFDLHSWVHGDSVFGPAVLQSPESPNGASFNFFNHQQLAPTSANSKAFLRIRVFEGQTLPEDWQLANFGHVGIDPGVDLDGDGRSNFDEFLHDSNPNDYYNGRMPELTIVSGDNQNGDPSSVLTQPLVAKASFGGQPLANAPIAFSDATAAAEFGSSPSGENFFSSVIARTDGNGLARVYCRLPAIPLAQITMSVSAGGASAIMSAATNDFPKTPATMSILSGADQTGLPGHYVQEPLIVRLLNGHGQAAAGAQVTFSVVTGEGAVVTDRFVTAPSNSVTVAADDDGVAWVYHLLGPDADGPSVVHVQCGKPAAENSFTATPVTSGLMSPRRIAVARHYTLACYEDGTIWSWGQNGFGQLGDGTTSDHWHREQVVGLQNAIAVSTREETSVALRDDGTVWTWGSNDSYALGNGTEDDNSVFPTQVLQDPSTPLTNVVAIASGYAHHLALKSDGTVWAWGTDWGYQLGNDSEEDSPFAIPVMMPNGSPLANVAAIACGDDHNVALKSDGTVWTWGYNGEDELGTGDPEWAQAVPTSIPGLTNVVAVAAGATHTLALNGDGTVSSWGENSEGCLGNGESDGTEPIPVQVIGLDHVIVIGAGEEHSLALRSDGSIWAWGSNEHNQLGGISQKSQARSHRKLHGVRGSGSGSVVPVRSFNIAETTGLAAGGDQTFAVTADGELLGWGLNTSGELGNRPQAVRGTSPWRVADFRFHEDPDHDGLATWKEILLGGNPNAYSTVGDAISDGWKAFYHLSLTDVALATKDLVGKGMTILQDFMIGTDPTRLSTVNDGIADGWKVGHGFDPFDANLAEIDLTGENFTVQMLYNSQSGPSHLSSLHDGIPDQWKIANGFDITDPSVAENDPDQDGLTNYEEYTANTSPNNAHSDSDAKVDGEDGWPLEPSLTPARLPNARYAIIDLGPEATATSINNDGTVVGNDAVGGYIWKQGLMTRPGSNGYQSLTNSGAFLTSEGVRTLGGGFIPYHVAEDVPFRQIAPADLNDNGTVIAIGNGMNNILDRVPVSLSGPANDLRIRQLPNMANVPMYIVTAIATDSTLAGHIQIFYGFPNPQYEPEKAFVEIKGTDIEIGTLPAFNGFSDSRDVITRNGSHYVIGYSALADFTRSHAFLWHDDAEADPDTPDTALIDLKPVLGARRSWAWSINQRLEIVGWSEIATDPYVVSEYIATIWRNGQPVDLNTLIDDPTWHLDVASCINDNGVVVGTGTRNGIRHAFLLVPAEIMVDANRDGKMSFDDPAIHDLDWTSADRPFRFWLNDDDDNTDGTEKVPVAVSDAEDAVIDGKRDLEDFTRLRLFLGGLQNAVANGDIKIGVEWRNATGSPAIWLYRSYDRFGSDSYLKDEVPANNQVAGIYGISFGKVALGQALMIDKSIFQYLTASNPQSCLLFEAAGEGKGQLVFTLWKGGQKIGESASVCLDLKNIKKMYVEAKASPDPDYPAPYDYTDTPPTPSVGYVIDAPHGNVFDKPLDENKRAIVFVHGWKMDYQNARNFAETFFKRLWWQGYKGRFCAFRWPSLTGATSYNTSEYRAWKYGPALAQFITSLPTEYSRNVVAHSMGNVVTGSALLAGMEIDNYALMQAAVPAGSYDESGGQKTGGVNGYARFWNAEADRPTPDFASSDLGYRGYFSGVGGNLINLYNEDDFALGTEVLTP